MSNLIANYIANWLVNNGAKEDKKDVYVYGIESLLNTFFTFGIILIVAICMNKTLITLVWFAFFLPLRHTSGGSHASTPLKCFILSIIIGIGCIILNPYISRYIWIVIIGVLLSFVVIFYCAPVVHPNHPIPERRIKNIRKTARAIIVIQTCLIALFLSLQLYSITAAAVLGILPASMSTGIGYFNNKKSQNCNFN